jgi:hypothetical protein
MQSPSAKLLRFNCLHFNDAYEITENKKLDNCGGISRFTTLFHEYQKKFQAYSFFSGDLWSPSPCNTHLLAKNCRQIINLNHHIADYVASNCQTAQCSRVSSLLR